MDDDQKCLCGHRNDEHWARVIGGTYREFCNGRHCDCTAFEAVDEPQEFTVEELGLDSLIYSWDSKLCTSCEWRTSADVEACLQCGSALTPVRIEVHRR